MKVKPVFWIIFAALIIVAAALAAMGKGSVDSEKKEMIDMLTSNVWIGTRIEMPGLSSSVQEIFGSDIKITLQAKGKCFLEIRGKILNAKWTLNEDEIHIRGKGINTKGHFDPGNLSTVGLSPTLTLYDIENYMIIFYSET